MRTKLIAVGAAVIVVLTVIVIVASSGSGHKSASRPDVTASGSAAATTTVTVDPNYHPTYNNVGNDGSGPALSGLQIASLVNLSPPSPDYTPSLPALSAAGRRDAVDFAVAFTTELLDIHFASETPEQVAAWAQAESAAFAMPGVPQNAADNSLFASLFAPSAGGGSWDQDPLPQPSLWAKYAKAGETWSVTNLFASEDPTWAQNIASGEAFPDPLMTVDDVTGTITTAVPGQEPSSRPFKLILGLGSALHHTGYGAVSAVVGS